MSVVQNTGHPITEPAHTIAQEAELVRIASRSIVYMAAELASDSDLGTADWLSAAPQSVTDYLHALTWQERIAFFTVFHSVGFSYWGEPRWQIKEGDTTYDGAMAWLVCLSRDKRFLQGDFLQAVDAAQWQEFIRGCDEVEMPMLAERLQLLQELGQKLEQFKAMIANKATTGGATSALGLAFYIAENLPGFNDRANYKGLAMPILKRAQLLASDLNQIFSEHDKPLIDIDQLTASADYKIPQLLRAKDILVYDDALAAQIDQKVQMVAGCQAEIEIRACTIVAVEKLRIELLRAHLEMDSRTVDRKLWLAAQRLDKGKVKPYHRCRTINY